MLFQKSGNTHKQTEEIIRAIKKGDIKYLQAHVHCLEELENKGEMASTFSQLGNRYMNLKVLGIIIVGGFLGVLAIIGSLSNTNEKILMLEKKLALTEEKALRYKKLSDRLLEENRQNWEAKKNKKREELLNPVSQPVKIDLPAKGILIKQKKSLNNPHASTFGGVNETIEAHH